MPIPSGRLPGWTWLVGGGLLAVLSHAQRVEAGVFDLSPKVSQTTTYDDNVGLQSSNKVSTLVSRTGVDLDADMGTAATNLKLYAGAALVRYFSENRLNTDDENIGFDLTHSGRRHQMGLKGSLVRDTGISNPLDLDSGRGGLANERRYTYDLAPNFAYQLDQTQSIELSGAYTHRDFSNVDEDEFGSNAAPYSQYRSSLDWLKRLDPRLRAGVGVNAIYVDTSTQKTSLASAVGIVEWQASPRLALNGNIGPGITRTETTLPTGLGGSERDSEDTLGYYFEAGIDWLPTPRTTTKLSISRSIQPYGTGQTAVTRNSISLSGDHKLSRRLSFNMDAVYLLDQSVGNQRSGSVNDGDITAIYLTPSLRWAVTKEVDLSLAYRLRYKSFENSDSDATSQAIIFRVGLALPTTRSNW
ncbi:uncharacterized protein, PEP-CTERM system associated [Arboricoccus pini]|uniref:Uncharacterized protein, PEP-CTERM system associated n=1 Tax=Arboricoccus pini TaxID=1963835 RepID=A0A212R3P7_9PROT|nr:outer membrane beta-barrel protein [Arboricoccus pini]SNB66671.1 uncharacterized protein, PEP-CTERM system associated [Arboricoccus pini]